jgi:hypothetical protein
MGKNREELKTSIFRRNLRKFKMIEKKELKFNCFGSGDRNQIGFHHLG